MRVPGRGGTVAVDLKTVRKAKALKRMPDGAALSDSGDRARRRVLQNVAAVDCLLMIVVLGAWLIMQLRAGMKLETCIETGRRKCAPIESSRRSAEPSATTIAMSAQAS